MPVTATVTLLVVGAVWLGTTVLPPHTATATATLEEDFSTGVNWKGPPGEPMNFAPPVDPFLDAVGLVWYPGFHQEIANRLQESHTRPEIDSGYIAERLRVDADRGHYTISAAFSDDHRGLARDGANVVWQVYREWLRHSEAEARSRGIPHWDLASVEYADTPGDIPPPAVGLYMMGLVGGVWLIRRSGWADRTVLSAERAHRGAWVGGGVLGMIVSLTADHLGYGYPGFGVLQGAGLLASATLVFVGVAGLDPVDPETRDVPRTPAR